MKKILSILVLVLVFTACKSGKTQDEKKYSSSFEAQEYQLLSIEDRDVESMDLDLRVNTERNSISGASGCNNYKFDYNLDGENLDLGYAVVTKMYCEDTMEIENAFFKAASKVKHFSLTDNMLYFLDEEGKVVLKAKKQNRKADKEKK